jgi:hypothetical protein
MSIGHGFNNAVANLYLNAQLVKGIRVAMAAYLSPVTTGRRGSRMALPADRRLADRRQGAEHGDAVRDGQAGHFRDQLR